MIRRQIRVLDDSYSGRTGGAGTASAALTLFGVPSD